MERTFFLALDPSQADQLSRWCARYRSYAWHHLEPTPERNQVMKVAQAVRGGSLPCAAVARKHAGS